MDNCSLKRLTIANPFTISNSITNSFAWSNAKAPLTKRLLAGQTSYSKVTITDSWNCCKRRMPRWFVRLANWTSRQVVRIAVRIDFLLLGRFEDWRTEFSHFVTYSQLTQFIVCHRYAGSNARFCSWKVMSQHRRTSCKAILAKSRRLRREWPTNRLPPYWQ